MSVDLITGHSGTNHISSYEARLINRSVYGYGNYRLKTSGIGSDYVYAWSSQSGSTYKPRICQGLLCWGGMLIYLDTDVYGSSFYDSLTDMKVYLHYTKDSSTMVESVAFEFSFEALTEITLNENAMEARVLFGKYTSSNGRSFTYGTGQNGDEDFNLVERITKRIEDEATARATADTTETTSRQAEDAKKVNLLSFAYSYTGTNPNYDRVLLGSGETPSAAATSATTKTEISLSESIDNFAFIEIRGGATSSVAGDAQYTIGIFPTSMVRSTSDSAYFSAAGGSMSNPACIKRYVNGASVFELFAGFSAYGNKFNVYPIIRFSGGERQSQGIAYYYKIYGVGRISS